MTDEEIAGDVAVRAMVLRKIIEPILAGQGADVQSAVLADLTAMWLAGHIAETKKQTKRVREMLLRDHVKLIRDLIEPSEGELLDRLVDKSAPQ
jgi:hypothetical protein